MSGLVEWIIAATEALAHLVLAILMIVIVLAVFVGTGVVIIRLALWALGLWRPIMNAVVRARENVKR